MICKGWYAVKPDQPTNKTIYLFGGCQKKINIYIVSNFNYFSWSPPNEKKEKPTSSDSHHIMVGKNLFIKNYKNILSIDSYLVKKKKKAHIFLFPLFNLFFKRVRIHRKNIFIIFYKDFFFSLCNGYQKRIASLMEGFCWNKFIMAKWSFAECFSNYINLLCMEFIKLYINYRSLSTPGDL